MAHIAVLDENNVVTQVIVAPDDVVNPHDFVETLGIAHASAQFTSYNNNFYGHFAGIGHTWSKEYQVYIEPKRFQSWVLNTTTGLYNPQIPYPSDNKIYEWDEDTISWRYIGD